MPVIRINDNTWERLKKWAVPLEDTAEDTLKKVLDVAEEHLNCPKIPKPPPEKPPTPGGKIRKGKKLQQEFYHRPILEVLVELGGKASTSDTLKVVEQKIKPFLTEVDYQKVPSGGDIRWRNTACFVRADLVRDGLLKADSPHGIWEISELGQRWLSEQGSKMDHDPQEDNPKLKKIFEQAEAEANKNLANHPKGLGFCHTYWAEMKRILKEKYEIDWKSPAEMRPDICFD
jgi:hypothetical protein